MMGGGALLATLAAAGCGGKSNATGTTGTTSTTGAGGGTTTSTTTATTATTATTGTGGSTGSGHDPSSATPVTENSETAGTLVDAATADWYSFSGTAGDRVLLAAYATKLQTENQGYDAAVTQTTLVLLGADMNQSSPLTYQAGQWPAFSQDAVLYVQLPTTGTYYLGVQDWTSLFSSGCGNPASGIKDFAYSVVVAQTSKLTNPDTAASSTNTGTTANADAITYKLNTGASYYSNIIDGDFPNSSTSAGAVQVFSFTPPTGATPTAPRSRPRGVLRAAHR